MISAMQAWSENSSVSQPKARSAGGTSEGGASHGSQKTHARSIAQRRRRSRHAPWATRNSKSYDALMQANYAAYDVGRRHAGLRSGGEISAHAGLSPGGRGEQVQRLVRQDRDQGRAERQARRQEDRAEGQCLPRRRADDERRLDARRLYRPIPTPPSSRASSMPAAPSSARRIANISASPGGSHTCAAGPVHNPHKMGYSAGGSSSGSARRGRDRRGRHGDRRRPGRIDPHPVRVQRHLRHEGHLWPGALYRRDADRAHHRSHRADDGATCATTRCCWKCWREPTGSTRGRSAPKVAKYTEELDGGVKGLRIGVVTGRLWASEFGSRRRRQGQGGRRTVPEARRDRRRDLGADASGRARDLAADRRRRRHRVHDEGQRHGDQLARSLQHHAARRPFRLAASRRRTVRQPQDHDAARAVFHQALSRAFLCQGAKPEPQAACRL